MIGMERIEERAFLAIGRHLAILPMVALLCLALPAIASANEAEDVTPMADDPAIAEPSHSSDNATTYDAEGAPPVGASAGGAEVVEPAGNRDAEAGEGSSDGVPNEAIVADGEGAVPELSYGLQVEGNSFRYRYDNGSLAVDEWVSVDGERYYFDGDGLAVSGRQKIDNSWYYFADDCAVQTGWATWKDGTKSYFDHNGRASTGWQNIDGERYYFDPSTAASVRWTQKIDGSWYYFDGDSRMATGLVTWYGDGAKSLYAADGKRVDGWQTISGSKYYFNPVTGKSVRWSQKIGGSWYYFDSASRMATGLVTWADGTKSYYDSQGRETAGWVRTGGSWYYFEPMTGKSVRWSQKIGGSWYYFGGDGRMHTGWLKWDGVQKWSYFYSNGQQAFGTQTIGGYRYVFDSNGETSTKPVALAAGHLAMWNKAQNYYSNTNYIILVNSRTHKVGIFHGSSYNWEPVWYWDCTTGALGSPTVKGTFTVGARGKSFGSGYTCWYWTQFYGNYLFHSVLYQPGSLSRIQDGRLGVSASHGCVRLDIECARWIYNNIPRGTRVVSY